MKILVSGAGIAGLTVAWWLQKQGHQVKIIEVAPHLRDKGYMMDFFGPGYDVAEKMGILESLEVKKHKVDRFCFLDSGGSLKSSFSYKRLVDLVANRYALIMRGDLVNVLHDHLSGNVDIHYATSLEAIQQDEKRVTATYNSGHTETFDFIIGADGLHSRVRRLVFGPEEQFRHYMGFYVASFMLEKELPLPLGHNNFYAVSKPWRQAILYPIAKKQHLPMFAWRTEEYTGLTQEQKQGVVKGLFQKTGWLIPEISKEIKKDTHLYFDTVSQIRMKNWSKGKVVLVGDACACLSLLAGQGSSFAMAGAYLLAESIQENGNHLSAAFKAYESKLKPIIIQKQETAQKFSNSFVPNNKFDMWLRDLFIRIMFFPVLRNLTKKQLGGNDNNLIPRTTH